MMSCSNMDSRFRGNDARLFKDLIYKTFEPSVFSVVNKQKN